MILLPKIIINYQNNDIQLTLFNKILATQKYQGKCPNYEWSFNKSKIDSENPQIAKKMYVIEILLIEITVVLFRYLFQKSGNWKLQFKKRLNLSKGILQFNGVWSNSLNSRKHKNSNYTVDLLMLLSIIVKNKN